MRSFILFVFAVVVAFTLMPGQAVAQRDFTRDNIVFILVDDMGYGDLNSDRMPKLDALLGTQGGRFNNFIVHQNCTPSRAAFLTGNDPSRINMYANFPLPLRRGIPPKTELVSERLQSLGYSTCHVGKWGMGRAPSESAFENGFDDSLQNSRMNNVPFATNRFQDIYQTDAALKFLERADEPFFLYAALESPHEQYKAPRDYFEQNREEFEISAEEEYRYLFERHGIVQIRDKQIPEEIHVRLKRALYYSMINVVDDQVARMYDKLKEEGREDHTFFMFVSDNGGIASTADNGVYREGKDTVYEGGHRAANGIVWPGVVRPGQEIASNVWIGDMFATFSHVAGEEKPGIGMDGGSFIPAITRKVEVRRGVNNNSYSLVAHVGKVRRAQDRHLIHGEFAAWRLGYKYIRLTTFDLNGNILDIDEEIYNLDRDPGETLNLAGRPAHSKILLLMRKEYSAWGGTSRHWSLRLDNHAREFPNWKPPASWSVFRRQMSSDIWP